MAKDRIQPAVQQAPLHPPCPAQGLRLAATSRRDFLRRGFAAGLGATALYLAPSFITVEPRPAYAGITQPCDCEKVSADWIVDGATLENGVQVQDLSNFTFTLTCAIEFYAVTGTTIAQVIDSIKAKRPFPGPHIGSFLPDYIPISHAITNILHVPMTCPDGTRGWKTQVTIYRVNIVNPKCTITYPKWTNFENDDDRISFLAWREWERFKKALETHEEGHQNLLRDLIEEAVRSLVGYQATAVACDPIDADDLAKAEVEKFFFEVWDSVNAEGVAYDVRTRHGEGQGAVLDPNQEGPEPEP